MKTTSPLRPRWPSVPIILLTLLGAFFFRLGFGLSLPLLPDDQFQTYLLGLKSFTTGTWPYFGPDLAGSETTHFNQIPGALEGLVVGFPFHLCPIPEAPFILLNLLSLAGIALLTWYCAQKVPTLSPWFIFTTLVVLPWTLHENTGMITRAWCLFGSCVFFVGFFESLPDFRMGIIKPKWAAAMMGFALFWVMQFHMSWIYLAAFFGLSLLLQFRDSKATALKSLGFFLLGSLPTFALIVPTLVAYGIPGGKSPGSFATFFNYDNFKAFFTILGRTLALPTFEMPSFLDPPGSPGFTTWEMASGPHWDGWAWPPSLQPGHSTHARIEFLMGSPFLFYPGLFLWIVGLLQAVVLLVMGFFRDKELKDWTWVRALALFNLILMWASFWFTGKWPLSHIFYDATFPVTFLFSLFVWNRLASSLFWRRFAVLTLAAAFIFQAAFAWRIYPAYSLYRDRTRFTRAIDQKNYRLLGERRPLSYY
jgi:hypothetical protein